MIGATLDSALVLGTAYALIGVAVSTVAVSARTLHLAIGPVLVVAVVGYAGMLAVGLPAPLAALAAVALVTVLSTLLESAVLRPLAPRSGDAGWDGLRGRLGAGPSADLRVRWVVGLAVAAALIETASARWLTTRPVRPATLLGDAVAPDDPGALVVAVVGGAVGVGILLWGTVRTRWGRRLRLVGGSHAAAELAGVSPGWVRASAFAVSGAAAGLAGVLIAPLVGIGVGQAGGLTLRAIAAAVILGLTSPLRAVAAGALLGLVEAVALGFVPAVPAEVWVGTVAVGILCLRGGQAHRSWGRVW